MATVAKQLQSDKGNDVCLRVTVSRRGGQSYRNWKGKWYNLFLGIVSGFIIQSLYNLYIVVHTSLFEGISNDILQFILTTRPQDGTQL